MNTEVMFEKLVRQGLAPIHALCHLFPTNNIFEHYRQHFLPQEEKLFIQELELVGFDIFFYKKYFLYSSGLRRTEMKFIESIPEITNITDPYQFAPKNFSDLKCNENFHTPILFGVVAYNRPQNGYQIYYYEGESDYLLMVNTFRCYAISVSEINPFATWQLNQLIVEASINNIDLIIVGQEQGKHRLLIDVRSDDKIYLYHRSANEITPDNLNFLILSRITNGESIYSIIPDLINRINPLFLHFTDLWPREIFRITYIENIDQLITNPDKTPDTVKALTKWGISLPIVSQYVVYPSGRPRTIMPFIPRISRKKNYRIAGLFLVMPIPNEHGYCRPNFLVTIVW